MFEEDRKEKRRRDEQKKMIQKEMQGKMVVKKEEKPGQDQIRIAVSKTFIIISSLVLIVYDFMLIMFS